MRERPETQGARHWSHRQPARVQRGEQRYNARLNVEQVRHIRVLRGKGWSYPKLSALYEIHKSHARDICLRKRWAHV